MDQEHHRQVFGLFQQACDLPPEQRDSFLAEACGDDRELRAEVESLLARDRTPSPILIGLEETLQPPPSVPMPARVGRYRILGLVGQGGMGVVYRAEQDSPRRIVAVKVLRAVLATAEVVRRFTTEAQILARLQHPGIAQILEAGVDAGGAESQPYFAMEFIDGRTLLCHAESEALDVRDRLRLFVRICDAVQHAHQRGVIHRDLKPGNILVDAAGQSKILDFGVGRLVDAEDSPATQTRHGQIVGTLPYMSPEQLTGEPGPVDTRTDVYTLGIVLHELLAGRPPRELPAGDLIGAGRILQSDAPRLGRLDPRFRGDLETIVAKCLEPDRERRYASVSELAADVRRHLDHLPITARPPGALYQLQKFTRRHRGLVAGIAVALLAVVAGTAGAGRYAYLANEAARTAEAHAAAESEQRRLAEQLSRFLTSMFESIEPDVAQGHDVRVRELLDPAARRVETEFRDSPGLDAALRLMLGRTYLALRLPHLAEPHLATALDLRERRGEGRAALAEALIPLGRSLLALGRYDPADQMFQRLESMGRRGPRAPEILVAAVEGLAEVAKDRYRYREAFAHLDRLELLDDSWEMASVELSRGEMYRELGKWRSAREALERSEALLLESGRERSLLRAEVLGVLGRLSREVGDRPRALEAIGQSAELYADLLGAQHPYCLRASTREVLYLREYGETVPDRLIRQVRSAPSSVAGLRSPTVANVWNNLGLIAATEGRFQAAEVLHRRALAMFEELVGRTAIDTAATLNNLAAVQVHQQRMAEAEDTYRRALRLRRQVLGESPPANLPTLHGLAQVLLWQRRPDEAEPLAREALQISMNHYEGAGRPEVAWEQSLHGVVLCAQGQVDEGEALLRDARETLRETLGEFHVRFLYVTHELAHTLALRNEVVEAEELFLQVAEEYALDPSTGPVSAATALSHLGQMLYRNGNYERALEVFERSLENHQQAPERNSRGIVEVLNNIGTCHLRCSRWSEAEVRLREAVTLARESVPPTFSGRLNSLQNYAVVLERVERLEDSVEVWEEVYATVTANGTGERGRAAEAARNLIRLHGVLDRAEAVTHWRARLAEVASGR